MANEKFKEAKKASPEKEVANSSVNDGKSSNKSVSAGSAQSTRKIGKNTSTTINVETISSSAMESLPLAQGSQSYDASITQVDAIHYLNLPTPNVVYNSDPQMSRDGGEILKELSRFSKVYKAKVANVVPGGHSGIAMMASNPIHDVEDRSTGFVLHQPVNSQDFVQPDAVNFLLSLNVSGHFHKDFINKVNKWSYTDVDGLQADEHEAENINLFKLRLPSPARIQADTEEAYRNANLLINGRNNVAYNIRPMNFDLALNSAELRTNYNNAFNMDIDTHNFFVDFAKLLVNINSIQDDKLDSIPSQVKTEEFVYTKIMDDIDFATFMYILIDSWKCNFDYLSLLGEKFGLVDNSIRRILNRVNREKRSFSNYLSNIMTLFDFVPVNSRVIDEWNRLKLASKLGLDDVNAEGNSLVIPHFKLLFRHLNLQDDSINQAYLSANANTTALLVPLTNLFRNIINHTNGYALSGLSTVDRDEWYGHDQNTTINPYNVHTSVNSDFCISAVRMTMESANMLLNVMLNDNWTSIRSYFLRYNRYYSMLNKHGIFEGTSFKFMKPQVPNLFSADKPQLINISEHAPYLSSLNPYMAGQDFAPIVRHDLIHNDNDFINNLRHYLVFDKYHSNAFAQKFVKGYVVQQLQLENETDNGGTVDNDVQANLICINLSSSIIIPFVDTSNHLFSMNVVPVVEANYFTLTQGVNQVIYETPMMFEYFSWASDINYERNISLTMPHIGGVQNKSCYFVSQTWHAFTIKMSQGAMARMYMDWNIPFPKSQFYSLEMNQTIDINGYFGFSHPQYNTYIPYWTYEPFAASVSIDALGFTDKYLTYQDLTILNK